ncbi:roadblock/LC7 domain-containing protein [Streptomyces niveus]|uniref:roadblock/LC7 domain-containing protein n=1 Tax=Streptomyces niveus TaxID=193462 RepID=UPI003427B3CB
MTETASAQSSQQYSMVLKPLLDIPKVRHVVVASSDGIVKVASADLHKDRADGVAAMSSAALSAVRAATNDAVQDDPQKPVDNPIETITTTTALGTLMIMPAGDNAFLVVVGERDMPMGLVAGTAARQARRLGEKLMSIPARDTGGKPS